VTTPAITFATLQPYEVLFVNPDTSTAEAEKPAAAPTTARGARLEPESGEGGKKRAILFYPAESLRQRSVEVAKGEDVSGLVKDLIATAKATKAAGLSAPQIGVNKRVIVIEVNGEGSGEYRALINPVIYGTQGEEKLVNEGCLSFPKLSVQVKRPDETWGVALTAQGLVWHFWLKGIEGQAVQHETEHLDGKLLIDSLSVVKKHQVQTKMKQMNRRLHSLIKLQGKKAQPASSYVYGYVVDKD
jgi:peptide deformylase